MSLDTPQFFNSKILTMKGSNAIFGFKKLIRFLVSIFASREMGFVYCLIGTITQIAHTYFLTYEISSLEGNWRVIQAVLLSTFISSSLLYFVVISDNSGTKESRRVHMAINIFMFIEILINLYYYSRHLIIDSPELKVFDFVFAILVSCLIPVVIKLYAGLIQAKTWFDEFAEEKEKTETKAFTLDDKRDEIKEIVREVVNESFNETRVNELMEKLTRDTLTKDDVSSIVDDAISKIQLPSGEVSNVKVRSLVQDEFTKMIDQYKNNLDDQVAKSFSKNSELFLNQFENKLKMLLHQYNNKKSSGQV